MFSSLTASGKEAVAESVGGMDALVPSARQQEGEESIKGVGGVVHNAGGLVNAELVVGGVDG